MGMIDEIRAQYEKLAAQNKMEAEDMIKARVAKAADQAAKDAVAIKDFKEQVGEYRKTVQTLHMEIDSLRSAVSIFFVRSPPSDPNRSDGPDYGIWKQKPKGWYIWRQGI